MIELILGRIRRHGRKFRKSMVIELQVRGAEGRPTQNLQHETMQIQLLRYSISDTRI